MASLNWNQVIRWRLAQHYLINRAERGQMLDVVSKLGGVHGGVWEYDKRRSQIAVKVKMFAPLDKEVRKDIEAEAARLGTFLGAEAEVSFSN